jgi:hypothetical protein
MIESAPIPKPIVALLKREAELQASVDKWSVPAFRAERDRLTDVLHSGAATNEEITLHSDFRDGGKVNADYTAMEASSAAALDAYRRVSWPTFRAYLRARLDARLQREADITAKLAEVADTYGIEISHLDPAASTTRQLEEIVERESVGWIRFGAAAEVY